MRAAELVGASVAVSVCLCKITDEAAATRRHAVIQWSTIWEAKSLVLPPLGAQSAHTRSLSVSDHTLRTLQLKYKIAYEAYQSCVKALSETGMNGNKPSAELLDNEAKALAALTEARGNLLAAMAAG